MPAPIKITPIIIRAQPAITSPFAIVINLEFTAHYKNY
jgi:hypothetical protein